MQSDKVLNLPAGYFGIVLGTIGMGFAWRYASQLWQVSHWYVSYTHLDVYKRQALNRTWLGSGATHYL